ncbi:Hypothetical protein PHPALM_14431 [Phytophthora palmivora]|uniref:Uncharacterized protein n=1 Tax=Phytophthora palmivora TaxID=4796 RepID=A0A2P4XUP4_9STRA|nr:Hypothetical protein PHPALM_14431 [Phytophthora palmivora]
MHECLDYLGEGEVRLRLRYFSRPGWQFSHVLASMALLKGISITDMMKSLPTRKLSGGGEADGIFIEMVKLSNDSQLKMDCEELAQCVIFAYT